MNKIKIFEEELNYIKNEEYRKNAEILLNLLPDYFFEIPASSTGKYHPSYALGDGGLVRHTKAAAKIAYELLNNKSIGGIFKEYEKDLIIISLIIHDGLKSGIDHEKYTRFDHPLLISQFVKDNKEKLTFKDEEIEFICKNVESHMGEWNTDYNGNEVLPLPKNRYQKFVHMCDFLASRKFLEVPFEKGKIIK